MRKQQKSLTGQRLLADKELRDRRRLLTNREFCERLGMSYEWGRKKVQRRQINFVQIGRSVRIPEEEIDRFIQANTVPAVER